MLLPTSAGNGQVRIWSWAVSVIVHPNGQFIDVEKALKNVKIFRRRNFDVIRRRYFNSFYWMSKIVENRRRSFDVEKSTMPAGIIYKWICAYYIQKVMMNSKLNKNIVWFDSSSTDVHIDVVEYFVLVWNTED